MSLPQLLIRAFGNNSVGVRIIDRCVDISNGFESAEFVSLSIAKRVLYKRGDDVAFDAPPQIVPLSLVKRRKANGNDVRVLSAEPKPYIQLSLSDHGTVYVDMDIDTIRSLGHLTDANEFVFDPETVDVVAWKTDVDGRAGFVYIRDYGVFSWKESVSDTMTYQHYSQADFGPLSDEKHMGEMIESQIR